MIELEKVYTNKTGHSFKFLEDFLVPKTEICSLHAIYDHCAYDIKMSIDYFIDEYRKLKIDQSQHKMLEFELKSYLEFYQVIQNDLTYCSYISRSATI